MKLKALPVPLLAAWLLLPGAAGAAPATSGTMDSLKPQADVMLVGDRDDFSGFTRRNYSGRWGYQDRSHRYRYGPYYGYRGYPYGYHRYRGPGFGFGLGAHPYGYGPSFGIYVNP